MTDRERLADLGRRIEACASKHGIDMEGIRFRHRVMDAIRRASARAVAASVAFDLMQRSLSQVGWAFEEFGRATTRAFSEHRRDHDHG